jgi:hypothetical protein
MTAWGSCLRPRPKSLFQTPAVPKSPIAPATRPCAEPQFHLRLSTAVDTLLSPEVPGRSNSAFCANTLILHRARIPKTRISATTGGLRR